MMMLVSGVQLPFPRTTVLRAVFVLCMDLLQELEQFKFVSIVLGEAFVTLVGAVKMLL